MEYRIINTDLLPIETSQVLYLEHAIIILIINIIENLAIKGIHYRLQLSNLLLIQAIWSSAIRLITPSTAQMALTVDSKSFKKISKTTWKWTAMKTKTIHHQVTRTIRTTRSTPSIQRGRNHRSTLESLILHGQASHKKHSRKLKSKRRITRWLKSSSSVRSKEENQAKKRYLLHLRTLNYLMDNCLWRQYKKLGNQVSIQEWIILTCNPHLLIIISRIMLPSLANLHILWVRL